MSVQQLLDAGVRDLSSLAAYLDALSPALRRDAVLGLSASGQRLLWQLTEAAPRLLPEQLLLAATDERAEIVHWGRNSLPLCSRFQKRLTRAGGRIWGYNEQPLKGVTGPGYFVVRPSGPDDLDDRGVVIDYTLPAPDGLAAWPRRLDNSERLGRFVYHGLRDHLRLVSRHVVIGRASRHGEWLPNWFVLVREN